MNALGFDSFQPFYGVHYYYQGFKRDVLVDEGIKISETIYICILLSKILSQ